MNDLKVALQFLPEIDHGIVLTVLNAQAFPYVRRAIIKELGVPDRSTAMEMVYSGKHIRMVSMLMLQSQWSYPGSGDMPDALRGFRDEQIFHVDTWEDVGTPCPKCGEGMEEGIQHGIVDGRLHAIDVCMYCDYNPPQE
jgi:hypothetical protein